MENEYVECIAAYVCKGACNDAPGKVDDGG